MSIKWRTMESDCFTQKMNALTLEKLGAGVRVRLENGLNATVYSLKSPKLRKLANSALSPRISEDWPIPRKYRADYLVFVVSVKRKRIYIVFDASDDDSRRRIIREMHSWLAQ